MKRKQVMAVFLAFTLGISGILGMSGCSGLSVSTETSQSSETQAGVQTVEKLDSSQMFETEDMEDGDQESEVVSITLKDEDSSCDQEGVSVDGQTITITKAGTYRISGSLSKGQIVVDAGKSDTVKLILDQVSVTTESGAALYVKQADQVVVTLAEGSENELSSAAAAADGDTNVDGAVFSRKDLTLNGSGSLKVTSGAHGIVCKDNLIITGGSYSIQAEKQGISGKESVRIAGGTFTIQSGGDGIHSENEQEDLGFVYISGGTFAITASGDGISASDRVQIEGGSATITTGGGSASAVDKRQKDRPGMSQETTEGTESAEDETSTKGIKAGRAVFFLDGSFTVDSCDDSLHSNGNVSIEGGTLTLSSGDDGIHGDGQVVLADGNVKIEKSYEGIEGQYIEIQGGTIQVTASDDGLNAAESTDSAGESAQSQAADAKNTDDTDTKNTDAEDFKAGDENRPDRNSEDGGSSRPGPGRPSGSGGPGGMDEVQDASITISGGTLTIDAQGDGIDSNGDLTVTGGTVLVSGAGDNGNGALDYNGDAIISGGTVFAAGMSGMAQNFGEDSTQGSLLINLEESQSGEIILRDSEGNQLAAGTPARACNSFVISCAGLEKGETYTLTAGSESVQITMESLVYRTTD